MSVTLWVLLYECYFVSESVVTKVVKTYSNHKQIDKGILHKLIS